MDIQTASFLSRQSLLLKFWLEHSETAGYDCLEVWRSTAGQGGPYSELTGDGWSSAFLSVDTLAKGISGKTMSLLVGDKAVTITFDGTDPLSPAEMANQINDQGAGIVYALSSPSPSGLAIITAAVGCGARLEITGGDAAVIIGFSTISPSSVGYGTDARVRLGAGNAYTLEDPWGQADYFYKTRLRRALDGVTSEFSVPLSGNPTRVVTPDRLIRGYLRIVDFQGRPVANRTIMISTRDTVHNSVVNGIVVDVADQTVLTDVNGYASVLLLRGISVSVGIAGTALVRDVVPPTDPAVDSFNLFDPSVGTDDAFKVAVPVVNLAQRLDS